jgi:energy-coupling factor transporter ATP-binding protein EcfA2
MSSLRKLTVAHLRGSTQPFSLSFEKDKKLTVIYGENGSGKSTLCDAFDLLGNGLVGSLEDRGLGGGLSKYWASIGKTPSEISVVLETASTKHSARLLKSNVVVDPQDGRPRVQVLRRDKMLALVTASAGERYEAIRRFIDVGGIEDAESALRDAIKSAEQGRDSAALRLQENRGEIQRLWQAAGSPDDDFLGWAQAEAKRAAGEFVPQIDALDALLSAYTRLTELPAQWAQAQQQIRDAGTESANAQAAFEAAQNGVASDAADMVSVLETAQAYLQRHPNPEACPVCQSAEKAQGLSERLQERIAGFQALREASQKLRNAQAQVERAKQHGDILAAQAQEKAEQFGKVRSGHQWPEGIDVPEPPTAAIDEWPAWLAATQCLPLAWRSALAQRQAQAQNHSALQGAVRNYTESIQTQRELDVVLPRLQRTLDIVVEERKRYTDKLLSDIANEVGRLYELVHPKEGSSKISLQLDAKKRASLAINTTFHGTVAPPPAYFSDSHMDTLGLCIFLANAKLNEPRATILVLDDVLGSVDEPHVERLIDLLIEECQGFRHCLIATHYLPWRNKHRWRMLRDGKCQFIELGRWTRDSGVSQIGSLDHVDQLRHLLAQTAPDAQLICAKAGPVLEALLKFVAITYSLRLPYRTDAQYTLGELLDAIDGKLRKALRVEVAEPAAGGAGVTHRSVSLEPLLDELKRIAQLRNAVGAHFNELSFDLLDSDAVDFGRCVHDVAEALTDSDSGWPQSKASGSYWATKNDSRRLHPLTRPT